jgi:hypothetical protein
MDITQLQELTALIESYQKLIKVQNDVIGEKEEVIVMLKKYIHIQEQEKELIVQQVLTPSLN